MISLDEYRQIREHPDCFMTAPGHHLEDTESQRETPEYTVRVRRRCA
jgi:hypothetical protein